MTAPTRLILVRHAEPTADARSRIYGRLDVELSPAGHAHAREIAAVLAGSPIRAVYTSPQLRAVTTATPLAEALGLAPIALDTLREIDFGDLEGLALDEIGISYPELLAWTEAPAAVAFPGGESVAEVRARSLAAVRMIVERHAGETVVAVAHSVVIRSILADALGMDGDALFRIDQAFGGISVIDWFGDTPLVRLLNASGL